MSNAMCATTDLQVATWRATLTFATEQTDSAVRRLIHALQRLPATGIYGADYSYRSLWDELCHEAQQGPFHDDVSAAWEDVLDRLLAKEVERLTPAEARLLWLATIPDTDDLSAHDPAAIMNAMRSALMQHAGERGLERFEVS